MTSTGILALTLAALVACANGAAVARRSINPMVWPMPELGAQVSVDPLIIGGDDAAFGEFPHQVSMQVSMLWLVEAHICGATIIHEKWALTAAHCVKGVPWFASAFILAGKTNLAVQEEGQQRSAVKKMFVHEKYSGGVGPFDIGLLMLKTPLVFSDTVKPARLPGQDVVPTGSATLSGWGSISTSTQVVIPNILQKVELPIIDINECHDWIQAQIEGSGEENPLADTNVCVGSLTQSGKGACSGDSGGPLIQLDENQDAVVIGATSWGYFPCQASAAPSVYTRVSAYVDWVNAKIASH